MPILSPRPLALALSLLLCSAPLWAQSQSFSIPGAPGGLDTSLDFLSPPPLPTITGPPGKFEPSGEGVYHGASLPRAWEESGLRAEIEAFRSASGKRLSVVTWFASLYENGRQTSWKQNYGPNLLRVRRVGAMSLVKFSTQDSAYSQTRKIARAGDIAQGKFDAYFSEFAETIKNFGTPVLISIDHEMNGTWYAYSQSFPGSNTLARDYKAAWRHIVALFRERGVSNVAWVWAPNVPDVGEVRASEYYPGDDVVDWVGPSFYSGNPIHNLRAFYSQWAGKKPIFITEWATAPEQSRYNNGFPGDALWVRSFFEALETDYPRVKGISWFQWSQADGNFLLQRVPEQAQSYSSAVQKPRYIGQANEIEGSVLASRPPIIAVGDELVLRETTRMEKPKLEAAKTEHAPRRRITIEAVKTEKIRVER